MSNVQVRRVAAVLGLLAVAAGAFGAHGLEGMVTERRLGNWETAARYHLIHALLLFASTLLPAPPRATAPLLLLGILLFSGSLYALVLLEQPILGAITPLGGLCFMGGWLSLAFARSGDDGR